jgi:hypothetical protein
MQNAEEEKARIREEIKKRVEQAKPIADEFYYQKFRAGNILAMVAGLIMLAVAGYMGWRDSSSASARTAVTGTVIGFEIHSVAKTNKNNRTDSSKTSVPIIQYTFNGKAQTVKGTTEAGLDFHPYAEGEAITILVNPADPGDVIIDTFSDRYLPMAGAGLLGLFFLGLGIKKQFLNK